ncbi:DNA-processing protein DprA [Bifidobacterium dolichotidis]|uniref:DNA-processing protein DprA n=1 Tax=Bifidobacterium dolichotidis TaxID=2306976 RepID=UPI0013DE4F27|nr:DNA-processing protein DprA [Bifidobacterium dolichotidis]
MSQRAAAAAVLSACTDGADAAMAVFVQGCSSTLEALDLFEQWFVEQQQQTLQATMLEQSLLERCEQGLQQQNCTLDKKAATTVQHALLRWARRRSAITCDSAQSLHNWLTDHNQEWVVTQGDSCWPVQLNDLSIRSDWVSPLCLWGMGDRRALTACDEPLAIIGSRAASDYGAHVARQLASCAVRDGHSVISGGALGIDAHAHWGAVDAAAADNAGPTLAVFAGGLRHIGPSSNMQLFKQMMHWRGALLSEMPPYCAPVARRFLMRNRIIAALASVVCVAQARIHSGALNTAHWAQELNRELYAVPGLITRPDHTGCHRLIDEQAARVLSTCESVEQLCHSAHQPNYSQFDAGSPTIKSTQADDELTAVQHDIITAIRSCQRAQCAATASHVLAALQRAQPHTVLTLPKLLAQLTELELRAVITNTAGCYSA